MTAVLGLSGLYHDSAAALVIDGKIIAAAQEERFTRRKHDARMPINAINFCLEQAALKPSDLDYVGFYEKPLLTFDRLLETYISYAPAGLPSFFLAMPQWLKEKLYLPRELSKALGREYGRRFVFTEHHESHAASAFFPSPFEESAIVTMDGVGEWATTTIGVGLKNKIALTQEISFPSSLGLLYSAFTYFAGFKVNSGEYKVMGLAPYGEPRYAKLILDNLIDLKEDGSFRLNQDYFNYCQGLTMTSERFHRLFGRAPRKPDAPIAQIDMDAAASIQKVTEEIVLKIASHAHRETGMRNLCLAGGVALNCVANGRILKEGPFDKIWIQPAAGDSGGALGTALFIWHQLLGNERKPCSTDSQSGSLLGPDFRSDAVHSFLHGAGASHYEYEDEEDLCAAAAELLAEGKIVGWMQGRMEFGPRALGARSILGDPRNPAMQSTLNQKIKFRESFRPFAASILAEDVDDYFEVGVEPASPYMLLVSKVAEKRRVPSSCDSDARQGLEALKAVRSEIPAVTHVDYSCRIQSVDSQRNPLYHKLLKRFKDKTGCPLLVNTSFNVRDEPIVCSPEDAYHCFQSTEMDALIIDKFLLVKDGQPAQIDNQTRKNPKEDCHAASPSEKDLLLFGLAAHTAMSMLGGVAILRFGLLRTGWVILAVAAASFALYFLAPAIRKPFHSAWQKATYPLHWILSSTAIVCVYFLVFTPIAAILRFLGRTPLEKAPNPRIHSYWRKRMPPRPGRTYYQIF